MGSAEPIVRPTGPENSYAGIGMAVKYGAESFAPQPQRTWPLIVIAIAAATGAAALVGFLVVYIVSLL